MQENSYRQIWVYHYPDESAKGEMQILRGEDSRGLGIGSNFVAEGFSLPFLWRSEDLRYI